MRLRPGGSGLVLGWGTEEAARSRGEEEALRVLGSLGDGEGGKVTIGRRDGAAF